MHKTLLSLGSREVERILRKYGFEFHRQHGSHVHFIGVIGARKRKVTVIANQKRFAPGTLRSMIRQSGLSEKDWLEALK